MENDYLKNIAAQFDIENEPLQIAPQENGYINKSFRVNTPEASYLLQQINNKIFNIDHLDRNTRMATWHIFEYRQKNNEPIKNDIWLIPLKSVEDTLIYKDGDHTYWRMMNFIPESISYEVVPDENIAFEGARKFAEFIKILSSEDIHDYGYPIERFHDIDFRLKEFENAIHHSSQEKREKAAGEIRFASDHVDLRNPISKLLRRKQIPLSIVHNDTKINNVLFNKYNGRGLCVIDLDTVMPGSVLFDFGDMMRTFTTPAGENEPDLERVFMEKDRLKALTEGFMSEVSILLTIKERQLLYKSGLYMTYMMGLRFLTDFLRGSVYYKTEYAEQNLVRCKNQFKLVESMLKQEDDVKIP